jgi:hypothetical protein
LVVHYATKIKDKHLITAFCRVSVCLAISSCRTVDADIAFFVCWLHNDDARLPARDLDPAGSVGVPKAFSLTIIGGIKSLLRRQAY